jgi:hypothetical protein
MKPLSLDIGQCHDKFSFTLQDLRQRIEYLKDFMMLPE